MSIPIHCEYEKIILKECRINEEFSKTIFDYTKLLKVLDLIRLDGQVKKKIELVLVNSNSLSDYRLKRNIINDITNLLPKLFIESGATLYNLDLYFLMPLKFKLEIFYTLGQNEQFLLQLQYLSLSRIENDNIDTAITCYKPQIYHALINVIKSQEQLELFGIAGAGFLTEFHGIISALDSQTNSLQEVIIDSCAFNEEFECYTDGIPDEELKKLVMQFSEILPLTVQYFDLDNCLEPYTDILLNHYNVPLKKLLIYNIYNKKIAKALIKFCIHNKTLNYMGVYEYLDLDNNIKKEMKAYVELVLFEHHRQTFV
ncbi:hypothetical protein F8M41_001897 [Gigaspora margarita]|uniref:Uncharacterized protein n=1 Tax=Gigaspora margarita TaxID=4874 RepID=A0A8H4A9N0_GIGMA|nr:hypothetical protein F8M41_001897 [Gigaspora margarita]